MCIQRINLGHYIYFREYNTQGDTVKRENYRGMKQKTKTIVLFRYTSDYISSYCLSIS